MASICCSKSWKFEGGVGSTNVDTVGLGEGEGLGDGVEVGEGVEVIMGTGFGITTPLFQISFFPDLIQVNLKPFTTWFCPNLVHAEPALADAAFKNWEGTSRRQNMINPLKLFRICKVFSN